MRIFVDGGAHSGEVFGWLDLHGYQKIYLVEPNWRYWTRLRRLGMLCPFALSDKDEVVPFYDSLRTDEGHSLLADKGEEPMSDEPTYVQAVDTARWLEVISAPDDRITLKLDIEGAEYPVLDHLLSSPVTSRIELITVEWHPIPVLADRKDSLIERMHQAGVGYRLWEFE